MSQTKRELLWFTTGFAGVAFQVYTTSATICIIYIIFIKFNVISETNQLVKTSY